MLIGHKQPAAGNVWHLLMTACRLVYLQVQTYHISTMTVSQRNALANSWLEEQEREGGSTGGGKARRNSRSKAGTALGETEDYNDSSSDDVQKDPVETWMLMVSTEGQL